MYALCSLPASSSDPVEVGLTVRLSLHVHRQVEVHNNRHLGLYD